MFGNRLKQHVIKLQHLKKVTAPEEGILMDIRVVIPENHFG